VTTERDLAASLRWTDEGTERVRRVLDRVRDDALAGATRRRHRDRRSATRQGRLVPATEIPWLRAREVMVHSVDLDPTAGFDDLPEDFLLALVEDIVLRRSDGQQPAVVLSATGGRRRWSVSGRDEPAEVLGSLGAIAAYLAGRPGAEVTASSGSVPELPPWL
jgi:maleylpyruvate isomerase